MLTTTTTPTTGIAVFLALFCTLALIGIFSNFLRAAEPELPSPWLAIFDIAIAGAGIFAFALTPNWVVRGFCVFIAMTLMLSLVNLFSYYSDDDRNAQRALDSVDTTTPLLTEYNPDLANTLLLPIVSIRTSAQV